MSIPAGNRPPAAPPRDAPRQEAAGAFCNVLQESVTHRHCQDFKKKISEGILKLAGVLQVAVVSR